MKKRRMRFCDECEDGVRYGAEARCKDCRVRRHREQQRARYQALHGVTHTCRVCGKAHGGHGTKARCARCERLHNRERQRVWRATWTPEYRARYAAYLKAYAAVGPGRAARELLTAWGVA